jgi:hypothetical protein
LFNVLLERASCIHGKVSNAHQIQVDIGTAQEHPMVPLFKNWWKKGMFNWRKQAIKGDIFIFVSELGPPNYAITRRVDFTKHAQEISDRWQQALLFKSIAQSLWDEVNQ